MRQLFEIHKRSWLAQTVRSLDNLSGFAVEMAEESWMRKTCLPMLSRCRP